MHNIGLHFTIAKGFSYAAQTVFGLGGSTFQFFSRNPRGSKAKTYAEKDINSFQNYRNEHKMGPLMAHAPYTLNLSSTDENIQTFSREVVKDDLVRMESLGIEYYNLHPGNHMGRGYDEGIRQIIIGLNQSITKDDGITVLLETMSGKGSEIGFRFEHLQQIIKGIKHSSKIGVCIDLCHLFSAGYDIVNRFDDVLDKFDEIIGIDRLKAVHLNDSLNPFNSRKDNHSPIGKGYIGSEAVTNIMNHKAVRELPFYIETPLDDEGHREEISMLRELVQERH